MDQPMMWALLTGKGRRWLGLTWWLLLVGLLVLPDVDRSIAQYQELGELKVKLASRTDVANRARLLAQRVSRLQDQMAPLEAALVPADAISSLKQDVTQMARAAKCRLRSIRPGPVTRRPLDDVLGKTDKKAKKPVKAAAWEVEEQASSVSIQGSFENLLTFLAALDGDTRIMQLDLLHLHPPPETTDELVLDLRVKTFNLFRNQPK